MTRIWAVVLLCIMIVVAVTGLVPATRQEWAWWWAETHDHAVDYMNYLEVWPNSRHVAEARLKYSQRVWAEKEKAMIHQAYREVSHSGPETDVEYRNQKRLRQDAFLWKAATNGNTLQSYQNYLKQFPEGRFARQARARIEALSHGAQAPQPVNSPPPQ